MTSDFYWNSYIFPIIFRDSGPYLNFFPSDTIPEGGQGGAPPHYCQVEAEIQVPHTTSGHMRCGRDSLLLLGRGWVWWHKQSPLISQWLCYLWVIMKVLTLHWAPYMISSNTVGGGGYLLLKAGDENPISLCDLSWYHPGRYLGAVGTASWECKSRFPTQHSSTWMGAWL